MSLANILIIKLFMSWDFGLELLGIYTDYKDTSYQDV